MEAFFANPAVPGAIATVTLAILTAITGAFRYAHNRRKQIAAENQARQEQILAANESALAAWKDFLEPLRDRVVELEAQRQRDRDRIVELESQGQRDRDRMQEMQAQHDDDRKAWRGDRKKLEALAKESVAHLHGIEVLMEQVVKLGEEPKYSPRRLEDYRDTQ